MFHVSCACSRSVSCAWNTLLHPVNLVFIVFQNGSRFTFSLLDHASKSESLLFEFTISVWRISGLCYLCEFPSRLWMLWGQSLDFTHSHFLPAFSPAFDIDLVSGSSLFLFSGFFYFLFFVHLCWMKLNEAVSFVRAHISWTNGRANKPNGNHLIKCKKRAEKTIFVVPNFIKQVIKRFLLSDCLVREIGT